MFKDNEVVWALAKPLIDSLFKEEIISFEEWYFMILSLRKKLGLLVF